MTEVSLRFDAAINPYGCSPKVVDAIADVARSRSYRHYGDPDAHVLRRKLGAHLHVSPDNILVYNGSGDGFVWLCLSRMLAPNPGAFICPYPSYERFVAVARRCSRALMEVPLDPETWALPLTRFIDEARTASATLAMISSPNNPSGNRLLDKDRLETLLEALPGCLVVIDEAYAEYTGETFAGLCTRWPNLVVLKTFSKAYGLAGLRVGYVVAHQRLAGELRQQQIPWAVDTLALIAAEAALADQTYLRDIVGRIHADVRVFGAALACLQHLRVHPTEANFFLVDLRGTTWERLSPRLEARNLRLRRRDDMPDRVRITSMLPEMNDALLGVLETP